MRVCWGSARSAAASVAADPLRAAARRRSPPSAQPKDARAAVREKQARALYHSSPRLPCTHTHTPSARDDPHADLDPPTPRSRHREEERDTHRPPPQHLKTAGGIACRARRNKGARTPPGTSREGQARHHDDPRARAAGRAVRGRWSRRGRPSCRFLAHPHFARPQAPISRGRPSA